MNATIEGGLIVTGPGTCAGYIFNFTGHGGFDPAGKVKVGEREVTQAEIDAHNALLASTELEAIKKQGRGCLYRFGDKGNTTHVGTWASKADRIPITAKSSSVNNWGAKRLDVWFMLDGSRWHGVNIGDNDIVRVKRCKS